MVGPMPGFLVALGAVPAKIDCEGGNWATAGPTHLGNATFLLTVLKPGFRMELRLLSSIRRMSVIRSQSVFKAAAS